MTNLAGATDLRNFDRTFAGSNQLRTRGTDILLAAARESRRQALYCPELLRLAVRAHR